MKKSKVCKGCKYYVRYYAEYVCDYLEQTGQSRMKIEEENGGYQKDYCVCYEKRTTRKRVKPWTLN